MSTLGPTVARLATFVALIVTFVAVAPASAHEGQDFDAVTVLARVDGRLEGVTFDRASSSTTLVASPGRELRLIDLDRVDAPATAIDFALETEGALRLEILDLDGNVVRTLAEGTWARGSHRLAWQHDSEAGEGLEEGLYVARLRHEPAMEALVTAR